jgi:hypothetical protein
MSVQNVGYGMFSPVGWTNGTTPGSATVTCGSILQSLAFNSSGGDSLEIAFDTPTAWNTNAWTPDASGGTWTCQVGGIYSLNVSQSLTVFNAADIVSPVVVLTMNMVDDNHPDLNQAVSNSIIVPVTTGPISLPCSVAGIVPAAPGTRMTFTLVSIGGDVTITSEPAVPYIVAFSFNLISQGPYGEASIL